MGIVSYMAREGLHAAAAPQHLGTVATRDAATLARQGTRPTATSCHPADGVRALSELSRFHQHYDYWEDPRYADLLAAWELQCLATEDDGSPIWRALARLIVAGMSGNGKSGTLDQIAMATGTKVLVKCTYPGIRDRIAKDRQVVILDDAQITFGAGRKSEDVRSVINAHTKGRSTADGRNGELGVTGQVAMAGLTKLLTGKVSYEIADTLSRCFVLWKARKPKGWHVPEVTDAAEYQVRSRLIPAAREWCATYRELLRGRAAWFGAGNPTGLPDLGGGGRGNDQLARPVLSVCDTATALAHKAWRDAGNDEADFPAEHDWAKRIRDALIFVSGVPEPVDDEESPLDGVSAAFDRIWADEGSSEDDIFAAIDGQAYDSEAGPPAGPPPAGQFIAGYAQMTAGEEPVVEEFPEAWWSLDAAIGACDGHARGKYGYPGRLVWDESETTAGMWGATIYPDGSDGPEVAYAVREIQEG